MNKFRWAFFVSFFFNIFFFLIFLKITFGFSFQIPKESKEKKVFTQKYWLNRNEVFEVLPKKEKAIVFLGNSLTQNFEWAEYFQNPNILNRGIFADSITGTINRLDQITSFHPKKVFIEIGINDLASGHSAKEVFANYLKLILELKNNSQNTIIYVQSVLPTSLYNEELKNYCNPEVNLEVIKLNEMLKHSATKAEYTFIELHSKFFRNGGLKKEYSADGVHISGLGYSIWANELKKYIID